MTPTTAGRIMVVIAILGLVVSVAGTTVAWRLIGDLDSGVGRSLTLTGEVLVTVDESFVIAEESLDILGEGVVEAESAVRALAASMAEGQDALASATALTGGEVADALESVERTLPAMESAAEAIDDTLGALGALPFGLSYDPDQPLAEAIGRIREELRGLPDGLREQAEQVERTAEELTAATEGTEATADSLASLRGRLEAASELVGDYAMRTGEVTDLVEDQREVQAASARRARLMVVAFGLVFAVSQFVPFYLGQGLLAARRPPGEV